MRTCRTIETPIGPLRLDVEEGALVAVHLPGERRSPIAATERPEDPVLAAAAKQLEDYFAGRRTTFDLPLRPRGTPFQRAVWDALRAIPPGETRSYGEIARAVGRPAAVRAVGAANGRNPLAIVVPCHRVIGAGGTLTGYAGGLEAKRWLLAHEARLTGGGAGRQRVLVLNGPHPE
ncbi:MAG TPA: methylated-DNA--[protein]-cysteine S-methyltransferase [Anaeromyxobacter sp.]|nr:methylated-DNA--[protein]-cysteine S-methyltransferase [Anaeromyxobacter sp.]